MPASARRGTASAATDRDAQVIDLTARVGQRRPAPAASEPARPASRLEEMLAEQGVDVDQQQAAVAQVWEDMLQEQQASLRDPAARAAVEGVAAMLERLVGGMIVLRQGDPARGIVADPTRGLDDAGVREIRGIVEDMRVAAAAFVEADVLRGTS